MLQSPTRTGEINRISGIYIPVCHAEERTIVALQEFARCGHCNSDTVWIFVQPLKPIPSKHAAPLDNEGPGRDLDGTAPYL
jgi:hypothetical protein